MTETDISPAVTPTTNPHINNEKLWNASKYKNHHTLCSLQSSFGNMKLSPWCLALLSFATSNHEVASFIPLSNSGRISPTWSLSATPTTTEEQTQTLSTMFGSLASSLNKLGYSTPTPIQRASAVQAMDSKNLLLIAPTGSGKTLAYLLPALTRAIQQSGTILVVAPTRELAVQLLRDTTSLISNLDGDLAQSSVVLAVRGVDVPTPEALNVATVLIGTPIELLQVLTQVQGGQEFVAGDVISTVILDEVDVLLPLPPKTLRTALDNDVADKAGKKSNGPQDERRRQEQRRKLMSAKRQGTEVSTTTKQVVSPTEKLLGLIASRRFAGGDGAMPCQILAGSATASRKTLDRLNKAVRFAAQEAPGTVEVVWGGDIIACRPEEDEIETTATLLLPDENENDDENDDERTLPQAQQHTIRAVTVPQQVKHRFVLMEKDAANSPRAVLSAVAKAAKSLKPKTALVFLCGDFAKAPTAEIKKVVSTPNKHGRKKTLSLKEKRLAASAVSRAKTEAKIETLSARKACSTLAEFGIEAKVRRDVPTNKRSLFCLYCAVLWMFAHVLLFVYPSPFMLPLAWN
jgi:hypothetical protein